MDRRPPVAARRPGRRTRLWRARVAVERDPRSVAGPGRARQPRAGRGTVGCTAVRVEAGADGWVLRATGADGTVRSARVDSAADRPPTRRRGVPRPEPGPDDGRRRGAGAGADPAAPAPTTATAPSTTPTGGRDPGARAGPRADSGARGGSRARRRGRARTPTGSGGPLGDRVHHRDPTDPVRWVLEDLDGPSPAPRRRGRRHGRIEVPPVRLSTPAVYRPGTVPGFAPALGVDFARVAATTVGYELGWCPLRSLGLPLLRQYGTVDLMFRATTDVGSVVSSGRSPACPIGSSVSSGPRWPPA